MVLEQLKLTNFKNYETARLEFLPGLNCLFGKNGMGKTNLLDAVYYLCMTKSHFSVPDSQLIRHGAGFMRLEGRFLPGERPEHIAAKVIPRKSKVFERNGKPYEKLSDHIGRLPVVFIAPDDTFLATEGSEARRRFLDNTLSQIDQQYLLALIRYNRLLKQRNTALKQMEADRRLDRLLLQAFEQQMLPEAQLIHRRRSEFAAAFLPVFHQVHEKITGAAETVELAYTSQLDDSALAALWEQTLEKDRVLQRTTAGIHRDDLRFQMEGRSLKRLASQGQLKSFILALKLAQYELLRLETGIAPILLLDDLFDKLDHLRIGQLLQLLTEGPYEQILITDTDARQLSRVVRELGKPFRQFTIEHGQVAF